MDPRNTFYRERNAIYEALARGENPYGGLENAINSIYNTYGRDSGVSYQEVAGIIGEAFNAAAPQQTTGGGGGARAAAVPTVTADLSGKINALNDMYNVIYQDLGNLAKEKRGNIEKSLGTQRSNLETAFQDTATQLPGQYNAQGIGQSSYYAKAAGKAQDVYNQNVKAIQDEQDQKLADLGQWYQSTMGQYQGQQAAVGATPRSVTGTQADVQGVQSGLDTRLNELGQARTGLQSQGQNIAGLASIAPSQNTGADQLKKMLGELATSSIPDFAKQTIAKGKIQQSGQDQTFYTDYFDKLKQPTPGA
jgi:hypothetical protein